MGNEQIEIVKNLDEFFSKSPFSKKQIYYVAFNKSKFYKNFKIPKKIGGFRKISAPIGALKKIQKWVLENILEDIKINESSRGFFKGASIVKNAESHLNKEFVLNIDLRNFFPSIKSNKILKSFLSSGLNFGLSKFLCDICTLNDALPQGAPTSPIISNIVCKKLDKRLSSFAKKNNFSYTRYADDITFSGDKNLKKYANFILKIIEDEGFTIAYEKLNLRGKGNRQSVTGIVVNEKINIPKEKKRMIRALINNIKKKGVDKANKFDLPYFKEYVFGNLAFLKQIDDNLYNKYLEELKDVNW